MGRERRKKNRNIASGTSEHQTRTARVCWRHRTLMGAYFSFIYIFLKTAGLFYCSLKQRPGVEKRERGSLIDDDRKWILPMNSTDFNWTLLITQLIDWFAMHSTAILPKIRYPSARRWRAWPRPSCVSCPEKSNDLWTPRNLNTKVKKRRVQI
jgi:hypothetical protein